MNSSLLIGHLANRKDVPIFWNPDSKDWINPHGVFSASSGSGKTELIFEFVKYLTNRNKHIYMFDLKGDLVVKDSVGNTLGNYVEFTRWDCPHGISAFEFDTGVSANELEKINKRGGELTREENFKIKNSGPKVQVDRIIEIIVKNFMPNMGTKQRDTLRYLIEDTYRLKGIFYNDFSTWNNQLPSFEDTLFLIKMIKEESSGVIIDNHSLVFINNLKDLILENPENKSEEINKALSKYISYLEENENGKTKCWFERNNISKDKYKNKGIQNKILELESYITALVDSGIFHAQKPPIKAGLNILNISGFDVQIQRFFVDVMLGKVFRACKIRGDYKKRLDKSRGEKCDTYVIIDEAKLISGNVREKNDPYSYLNRIATEARGFGLGLLVASQSANHFPPEFLKNFALQIILKTATNDKDTKDLFRVSEAMLEFTHLERFGNILIKMGRSFEKVKMRKLNIFKA